MTRREFMKSTTIAALLLSADRAGAVSSEEKLLRLKDRNDPSVLEKKHVPAVEAPETAVSAQWFDIRVRVGFMSKHPSKKEHWITKVKLLVNQREVAATDFKVGGVSPSEAMFRIRLEETSTVEAVENCNLHGTWISDPVTVTVT